MAYFALSRVRSLNGVYLTQFDPASIIVSSRCLEEVNRLRSKYRNDLGTYEIPVDKPPSKKRKITANVDSDSPPKKPNSRGTKRKLDAPNTLPAKRTKHNDPKSKKPKVLKKTTEKPSPDIKDCTIVW